MNIYRIKIAGTIHQVKMNRREFDLFFFTGKSKVVKRITGTSSRLSFS
jgi:hypothetical protein